MPCLRAVGRSRFVVVLLDDLVHLLDNRRQRLAGIFLFHEPSGEARHRRRLAVHDVYFGRRRAEGEGVVVVRLGAGHDVVGSGRALSENDGHHRAVVRLLDGVDQRLAEAEELRLFRDVADIDARSYPGSRHRYPVPAAEGDELIHLDQAFTVELAADARIRRILRIAFGQHALPVGDDADQEAVDLYQTRSRAPGRNPAGIPCARCRQRAWR